MQQVMNLVWDKLLPVMKAGRLPENAAARRQLEARLAGLTLKFPNGRTGARVSSTVSGKWFELADNDRGLKAVSIDFNAEFPTLKVRSATGETQTAIGMGLWAKGRGSFTNGLDHALSVPGNPLTAASGAWSEDETFTVKIVLYETPYYSTVNFKFDGDRLVIDSEHNVFFGSTKLPQLVGHLRASE